MSTVSKAFFEIDGCDPQRLVPLGSSLSELLERERVLCRGVARSEACFVSRLIGSRLKRSWLKSLYTMGIEIDNIGEIVLRFHLCST